MSLTTKLDAVNYILATVGEAPVSSLTGTTQDAAIALSRLDEITREGLSRGWYFNTETDVDLSRNASDEIPLPATALYVDVDPSDYTIEPVERGSKLYDLKNHRYTFEKDLKAIVVYNLDFEECPEVFRNYIKIRSARLFQNQFLGSTSLDRVTRADEQRAWAELLAYEFKSSDVTSLSNPSVARILRRS